jgi:nitroreductase
MHEGLYVHQMSGFDQRKAEQNFDIPENYEAVSVIALGYIGEPEILPERMQKSEKAERIRKELPSFIFSERFGQTSKLF